MLKRLGEEAVKELIPAEDQPLLAAILKAERKKSGAKVRAGEGNEAQKEEEETPLQTQRKRWIHEGEEPIDLLNVEDVAKGIRSRREEESEEEEVGVSGKGEA